MQTYDELLSTYKEVSKLGINYEYHKKYIPLNTDMKYDKDKATIRMIGKDKFQLYYVDKNGHGHDIEGSNLNQVCSRYWFNNLSALDVEKTKISKTRELLVECDDCADTWVINKNAELGECDSCGNNERLNTYKKIWFRGSIWDDIKIDGIKLRNYIKNITGHYPTWAKFEKELEKVKIVEQRQNLVNEIMNEIDNEIELGDCSCCLELTSTRTVECKIGHYLCINCYRKMGKTCPKYNAETDEIDYSGIDYTIKDCPECRTRLQTVPK